MDADIEYSAKLQVHDGEKLLLANVRVRAKETHVKRVVTDMEEEEILQEAENIVTNTVQNLEEAEELDQKLNDRMDNLTIQ
jgi:hypothetical protein